MLDTKDRKTDNKHEQPNRPLRIGDVWNMPFAESEEIGIIYMIRVDQDPESSPDSGYVKIGFTGSNDVKDRFKEAKRWVPAATVLKEWIGLKKWETPARNIITDPGADMMGVLARHAIDPQRGSGTGKTGEVARVQSISEALQRGNKLFEILGNIKDDEGDNDESKSGQIEQGDDE